MKTVAVEKIDLSRCLSQAQSERVILTENGKPVAVLVGVGGLDAEQVSLGMSDEFWQLIRERRKEPTISRDEVERKLAQRPTKKRRA